jgi:hypothetical protein
MLKKIYSQVQQVVEYQLLGTMATKLMIAMLIEITVTIIDTMIAVIEMNMTGNFNKCLKVLRICEAPVSTSMDTYQVGGIPKSVVNGVNA